jgi:hypothetical protein
MFMCDTYFTNGYARKVRRIFGCKFQDDTFPQRETIHRSVSKLEKYPVTGQTTESKC